MNIKSLLACLLLAGAVSQGRARSIRADYNMEKGPKDAAWRVCVGACHAALNLRPDWAEQLKMAHDDCGVEYVRFHGLLDDDMEIYKEDSKGRPSYSWKKL